MKYLIRFVGKVFLTIAILIELIGFSVIYLFSRDRKTFSILYWSVMNLGILWKTWDRI